MLAFYKKIIRFSWKDYVFYSQCQDCLIEETEVYNARHKQVKNLTWDDMKDVIDNHHFFPISVYYCRKGIRVKSFNIDIKSWKEPTNISVTVEYKPFCGKMEDLLEQDCKLAIQYLKEHGLGLTLEGK